MDSFDYGFDDDNYLQDAVMIMQENDYETENQVINSMKFMIFNQFSGSKALHLNRIKRASSEIEEINVEFNPRANECRRF